MLDEFCGDFIRASLGKNRILVAHDCKDVGTVNLGAANEGSASVFPVNLFVVTKEKSENGNLEKYRYESDCPTYVLGMSSAADLVADDVSALTRPLAVLLDGSPIVPELDYDQIETLAKNIAKTAIETPNVRHFFVAVSEDAGSLVPNRSLLDDVLRACIDDPNAAIHNIADFL